VPILKSSKKLHKLPPINEPLKFGQLTPGLHALLTYMAKLSEMRRLVMTGRGLQDYFLKEVSIGSYKDCLILHASVTYCDI